MMLLLLVLLASVAHSALLERSLVASDDFKVGQLLFVVLAATVSQYLQTKQGALNAASQGMNVAVASTWPELLQVLFSVCAYFFRKLAKPPKKAVPTAGGASGAAVVHNAQEVRDLLAKWPLEQNFLRQMLAPINLMVENAEQGQYVGRLFVFSIATAESKLQSAIVVSKRKSSTEVQIGFLAVTSSVALKQLFTCFNVRSCHRCPKCLWMGNCCCHTNRECRPRGFTPAEIQIVHAALLASQYRWVQSQIGRSLVHSANRKMQRLALLPGDRPLDQDNDPRRSGGSGIWRRIFPANPRPSRGIWNRIFPVKPSGGSGIWNRIFPDNPVRSGGIWRRIFGRSQRRSPPTSMSPPTPKLPERRRQRPIRVRKFLRRAMAMLRGISAQRRRRILFRILQIFRRRRLTMSELERIVRRLAQSPPDVIPDVVRPSDNADVPIPQISDVVVRPSNNDDAPFSRSSNTLSDDADAPIPRISDTLSNKNADAPISQFSDVDRSSDTLARSDTLISQFSSNVARSSSVEQSDSDFAFMTKWRNSRSTLASMMDVEKESTLAGAVLRNISALSNSATSITLKVSATKTDDVVRTFVHDNADSAIQTLRACTQRNSPLTIESLTVTAEESTTVMRYTMVMAACTSADSDRRLRIDTVDQRVDYHFTENVTAAVTTQALRDEDWGGSDVTSEIRQLIHVWRYIVSRAIVESATESAQQLRVHSSDDATAVVVASPRSLAAVASGITTLSSAVDAFTKSWTSLVNAFKTKVTVTVEQIRQLGFDFFRQTSNLLRLDGVPRNQVPNLMRSMADAFQVPPASQPYFLALQWTDSGTWLNQNFLYSASSKSNSASTLAVFKHARDDDKADLIFISVNSAFALAPDLLLVTTSKSVLGGLFESTKTKIEHIPHTLTLPDATAIMEFMRAVAFSKLADDLGLTYKLPPTNPTPRALVVARDASTAPVSEGFFNFNFWAITSVALLAILAAIIAITIIARRSRQQQTKQN